jgi:biotin synthase
MQEIRNDWSLTEIEAIYNQPLLKLSYQAATIHNQFQEIGEVQVCTLLSVKTGGCPEDCAYCPQSSRYQTGVENERLLPISEVVETAKRAKEFGSTRFCMGAAWRNAKSNSQWSQMLEMVKEVASLDLEVCCTLGMLNDKQAADLKEAGLYAYNHNLDSSEEFYETIITTRTYQDRLETIDKVRKADISVCSGGIIGMGETHEDRMKLLHTLSTQPEHPESVPVNALIPVKGTPMENQPKVPVWDMIRMIATARILMPKAMIRLSAGRVRMTKEEQALCFMSGANSIFAGDKLLTTLNNDIDEDTVMFEKLGLKPRPAYKNQKEVEALN